MQIDPRALQRKLVPFGQIASRATLASLGLARADIEQLLHDGQLQRIKRACYATPLADAEQVRAVHLGGQIGCVSALRRLGVWSGSDDTLHIAVARNASRLPAVTPPELLAKRAVAAAWHPLALPKTVSARSIRPANPGLRLVHWEAARNPSTVLRWVVSPEDALTQALRCQDAEHGAACADSIIHEGILTLNAVREIIANLPRRLHYLAADLTPNCGSGYESIFVRRMRRLGYSVISQYEVPGVGRLDGLIEGCVGFEVNSIGWHHSEAGFYRDIDRVLGSMAFGLPVVQISPREIERFWPSTEAAIVRLVEDTKAYHRLTGRTRPLH